MLARLHIKMPFEVLIPDGEEFQLRTYIDGDYEVRVGIPARSTEASTVELHDSVLLNGKGAFYADLLEITFARESFNRAVDAEIDPPYNVINKAIASFLTRLRYVSNAPQVQVVKIPEATWRLHYLDDDESELPGGKGLAMTRGAVAMEFSWLAFDSTVWEGVHSLPVDFVTPAWRDLLTDANGALPHIGTAIVLAATSLEVFISEMLDGLQSSSAMPASAWKWINNRANRQNDPTVEEQYSDLLQMLCGKSLKDDADLWQGFKNLKTARNSFVHSGRATVGGAQVTVEQAKEFVRVADRIISKIREWVPVEMRWPVFKHDVHLQIKRNIGAPAEGASLDSISDEK